MLPGNRGMPESTSSSGISRGERTCKDLHVCTRGELIPGFPRRVVDTYPLVRVRRFGNTADKFISPSLAYNQEVKRKNELKKAQKGRGKGKEQEDDYKDIYEAIVLDGPSRKYMLDEAGGRKKLHGAVQAKLEEERVRRQFKRERNMQQAREMLHRHDGHVSPQLRLSPVSDVTMQRPSGHYGRGNDQAYHYQQDPRHSQHPGFHSSHHPNIYHLGNPAAYTSQNAGSYGPSASGAYVPQNPTDGFVPQPVQSGTDYSGYESTPQSGYRFPPHSQYPAPI